MINRLTAVVALAGIAAAASAQITSINGLRVEYRQFNDFGTSNLSIGPAAGPLVAQPQTPGSTALPLAGGVRIRDEFPIPTAGNFANKHTALLSNDAGATAYQFMNNQSFDISVSFTMSNGDPLRSRKEGGFAFFVPNGTGGIDEGRLLVASNSFGPSGPFTPGETAIFGGTMPFTGGNPGSGWGNGTYADGSTVTLRFVYNAPGDSGPQASYEAFFNGQSSGLKYWDVNGPNGFRDGTTIGFVGQFTRVPIVADFGDVTYGNISITVPTPGALALIGLAGLAATRRRR